MLAMSSEKYSQDGRQAPLLPEGKGPGDGVSGRDANPHPFGMYTTDANTWKKSLKAYARTNRKNATPAENHPWQALRGNKLNAPFRRQHAIKQFIVDFVCLPAWLIIEVDGGIHNETGQAEYDGGRTHELQEWGFLVLRFTNEEVLHQTSNVLQTITEHLKILYPNYGHH